MEALSSTAESDPSRAGTEPTIDEQRPRRARLHAARTWMHARRERVRTRPALNLTYRVGLGTLGAIVLIAGLVMVPYPGPGWLIVFAGLGILATEFHWAHRCNTFAKRHYHRWVRWLGRQHLATKLGVMGCTGLIVLVTMWMLGLFNMVGGWFGLHWHWLASPLFGP
ncbi:TIGR02611 family protein [Saccharopolyspora sp. CA-218241]|uniref:TIGR02611 family protein n=1 Tax=Saccharopolyspora sp. CA-218241 TaxID=3240027 RepID=UPI003D98D1E7